MEELTEVITAAEFHPHHCNYFAYSSSKGILRLCDMRASALCDRHTKSNVCFFFKLNLLKFLFLQYLSYQRTIVSFQRSFQASLGSNLAIMAVI